MRNVIGIGETILDIIFENDQPERSVVGGSTLNALASLSRLGIPVTFISEVGDDRVGDMACRFMKQNRIVTDFVDRFEGRRSPVSLAFLDADKNAEYVFYTDYPEKRLRMAFPVIGEEDVFMFGSFYALNPVYRNRFVRFPEEARRGGALIYYDPNVRSSHGADVRLLKKWMVENCGYATVVRGSCEDFYHLFGELSMDDVYADFIRPHCRYFISTHGAEGVNLYADGVKAHFDSRKITPVSTIGAGDSFNAGFVYGLLKYGIRSRDLPNLNEAEWGRVIQCGIDLSSEVCGSYLNYISPEFAANYLLNI
jgi:fructokinase